MSSFLAIASNSRIAFMCIKVLQVAAEPMKSRRAVTVDRNIKTYKAFGGVV
jgi:hypothetical protein